MRHIKPTETTSILVQMELEDNLTAGCFVLVDTFGESDVINKNFMYGGHHVNFVSTICHQKPKCIFNTKLVLT